jgi:hypothetical protein
MRISAGQRRLHHRVIGKIDTHAQQGAGQTQTRDPRGADAHVTLARVLQDDHPRAGLQRRDVRAVANARRPTATLAQDTRRG